LCYLILNHIIYVLAPVLEDLQWLEYTIPVIAAGIILCCLGVGCAFSCLFMHRRRKLRKFRETLEMREDSRKTDTNDKRAANIDHETEQEGYITNFNPTYENVVCVQGCL
jgi:hypothetical protein